ncbi:hypothetical protein LX03_03070 [Limosilactobacillus mucosae]|uniref:Uncharacterized protein n=1 Tax=Limosilactobacillus mucosae TaxID=97478 RepID=A0A099YCX7_LIMMU|nr:hypothetical protein LX03_03070 [Limosilactobacillus mucosae]
MAVTQIQVGQKDWLSTLNSNLSQIGDFTEWSTAGITALNGLGNGKNLCWRKATQVVGSKKRVVIEIAGYVTIPSNIASNQHLDIIQLASNIYDPISTYFAQTSSVGGSPASDLEFDSSTGKITITNGYSFAIGNFGSYISMIIVA